MCSGLMVLPVAAAGGWYGARRVLRYLRYFQQAEYRARDYLAWLSRYRSYDRTGSAILLVALIAIGLCHWLAGGCSWFIALVVTAALVSVAWLDLDPRKVGKIKLRMTERAVRTWQLALVLLGAVCLGGVALILWRDLSLSWTLLWHLLVFQLLPFFVLFADRCLRPFEQRLQERYRSEAERLFQEISPFTIGITGSFGKTSTKAILGQLLNVCCGPCFWPEKGVNTLMGITREIRTKLSRHHRYAVMEMGAYYRGSIARLAKFTPPQAAIITAVGSMHLDRFGSAEDVYVAKSELAQAVPPEGILVCNADNPGSDRMAREFPKRITLRYGLRKEGDDRTLDCWASNIRFSATESRFLLHWQAGTYQVCSPLLGDAAVSNMVGAFTMCCALGAQPQFVAAALANLEQVDNRLVVAKEGEVTFLHDAYNSNPVGFRAALELLQQLPLKRRLLVTPGMIELGAVQEQENEAIAQVAARCCDHIIIVGNTNRKALLHGLECAGYGKDRYTLAGSREEAFLRMRELIQDGDGVLIENDLPDSLEFTERF